MFTTLGVVPSMKWSVTTLFGMVMNINVQLCSDWLFHTRLISVAHTANRNDGDIRHPTLYV